MLLPPDESWPLTLVPSLPAADFAELDALTHVLDGVAAGFQIDIVDGAFVPHTSWPFTEADPQAAWAKIMSLPSSFFYELDCMVKEPEQYLAHVVSLPIKRVIIHAGSTDRYREIVAHARQHGYQIGLAFTNDVPLSFIFPFIQSFDFVQVMGIAKVGQQGQPFDERTLTTVESLRDQFPDLFIAVDGSVNAETIPRLRAAGVNHFAPGSAISRADDPIAAYKHLTSLLL